MDKLAQDDFLGRVMAHAFTDELNKLAKATSLPALTITPGKKQGLVSSIRTHIRGGGSTTDLPGTTKVDVTSGGQYTSPGTSGITPVKTPTV